MCQQINTSVYLVYTSNYLVLQKKKKKCCGTFMTVIKTQMNCKDCEEYTSYLTTSHKQRFSFTSIRYRINLF